MTTDTTPPRLASQFTERRDPLLRAWRGQAPAHGHEMQPSRHEPGWKVCRWCGLTIRHDEDERDHA
jgi:hypothetical protein